MLAPDSWGAYQRNDFNEPRLLHLPVHRKVLNSLTWYVWFSLINSNLLIFLLPGLCCKNACISWLPCLSLQSNPSEHLRGCVLGLSPQNVLQIKHNSQLLGCAFFSVDRGITHFPHGWVSKAPILLEDFKVKTRMERGGVVWKQTLPSVP